MDSKNSKKSKGWVIVVAVIATVIVVGIAVASLILTRPEWGGLGDRPCAGADGKAKGSHPDGTEYFYQVGDLLENSICTEEGWNVYDPSDDGMAEVGEDLECGTEKPVPICGKEDDFGPEEAFPNEVDGPAIAELWNPETGFCGLVKVNTGETLNWEYSGAWWQAGSQEALDLRFPHHSAEYLAKESNTECKVFTSAADLP